MKELLVHWGIEANCLKVNPRTWSIGEAYILKAYTKSTELQRSIDMMKKLKATHVPVPEIIPTCQGGDFLDHNQKYYILYTKLKGHKKSDWTTKDMAWFFEFGQILAQLHKAFKTCQDHAQVWHNSLLSEMQGWVTKTLQTTQEDYMTAQTLAENIKALDHVYKALPKQLIHRDVHLDNFLFFEGRFTGYIDFDLSQTNIRIFDIAYFLLSLLVSQPLEDFKNNQWLLAIEGVIKGYHATSPLSKVERESMFIVMKNIEILCLAYFVSLKNSALAHDASQVYNYLQDHESRIKASCL